MILGEETGMAGSLSANDNSELKHAYNLRSVGGNAIITPVILRAFMAAVAQLVRASGCGPEGRAFNPRQPPHKNTLLYC